MTPEKQRIAIAEACGWKFTRYDVTNPQGQKQDYVAGLGRDRERCNVRDAKEAIKLGLLPDYLNDLNAMHEAEDTMGDPQLWDEYNNQLASAMGWVGWLYHATATQRAEAFLRTLNLWTP